jgi:hypothetical protein
VDGAERRDVPGSPRLELAIYAVDVDRWLAGPNPRERVEIVLATPQPRVTGQSGVVQGLRDGERGLLFLQRVPDDIPWARHLPGPAHRLAPGESGVRAFAVPDHDDEGNPIVRDETDRIDEMIAAVAWYAGIDPEDDDASRRALIDALDSPNPRIARHAIRALAGPKDPAAAELFTARLERAGDHLRVRLMLGLWILGDRDRAVEILNGLFRRHGEDAWLADWGIQRSAGENDQPIDVLYGPDPAVSKGD